MGFNESTYLVSEVEEVVEVCVNLVSGGLLERDVTIKIIILPGTATAEDYTAVDIELNFTQVGILCFNISITADNLLEETEGLSAVIVSSDQSVNVTQQTTVITIADSQSKVDYCVL